MTHILLEKERINWELRQKYNLKEPCSKQFDKVVNRKRPERYGYTFENKQWDKYRKGMDYIKGEFYAR